MIAPPQSQRPFDERVWEAGLGDSDALCELAAQDPLRFLWTADPPRVLRVVGERLGCVLLPAIEEADLPVVVSWLRSPGFLPDERAAAILEAAIERAAASAGWLALAEALTALAARGRSRGAARRLELLLDRFWLDAGEAVAVERAAAEFVDCKLLASMERHEPWRSDPARLGVLLSRCDAFDIARSLDPRDERGETSHLAPLAWSELARRGQGAALDRCMALLSTRWDDSLGRAGALDVVLVLQRERGEDALPGLVAVFLSGLHRSPPGELIERWLLGRPERALAAALEPLPDWMPRFERSAMDRLCWRLLPRLDRASRERVREMAEIAGGERGRLVLGEIESLGG